MNRGQIRASVERRTGIAFDETALNELIDEALDAYVASYDWPWLFTAETINTVGGTATYDLPADWQRTRYISDPEYGTLESQFVADLLERWPDTDTARPSVYALDGNEILLRAVPDAAYALTHAYVRTESSLANDSAEPLLPVEYRSALVDFVCAAVLDRAGHRARSEAAWERWDGWLKRMRHRVVAANPVSKISIRPGGFL